MEQSEAPSSTPTTFRIQAKKLFFTWPQNDFDTAKCVEVLTARFSKWRPIWIEAVKEHHKDGTLHLHALVLCDEKVRASGNQWLEMNGKHGHVKPATNPRGLHDTYFTKDVVEHFSYGEWPYGTKKQKISDEVATALLEGATVNSLVDSHPGFVLMHLPKIMMFKAIACNQVNEHAPVRMIQTMDPSSAQLAMWLGKNLFTKRRIRASQLYVQTEPGMGKTTTFAILNREVNIFRPCKPNSTSVYWDGYSDDTTDLILFDEWNQQWPITTMNDLLSGAPMTLKVHGGIVQKNKNPPIVILSNLPLNKNYGGVDYTIYKAFLSRFKELVITEPIRIFELN